MPKFRTQYDEHAPVYQEPGDPIKIIYSPRYDDNGVLDLHATGKEDLYAYIQSHAESVDIHVLLDRYVAGETDILERMQGIYADVSDMPKTYAEVLNSVIAGEEAFARLPIEIKQKFDNSFAVWMASMDQPDFAERMGLTAHPDAAPQEVQDFVSNAGASSAAPSAPAVPQDS